MKKVFIVILCTAASAAVAGVYPYGIHAHITCGEPVTPTVTWMNCANLKYVRSDFDAQLMRRQDGAYDFSRQDKIVDELAASGIKLLPIIWGAKDRQPPADLEEFKNHVRTIAEHFKEKIPVYEIWNEANGDFFFKGADPVKYAQVLKAGYEAVKSVDPSLRVAFGGTAGIPIDWIRKVMESGAANSFDIMNVHPYSHPTAPDGLMDRHLENLRKMMAEFGRGDAPIWITEIGWPTHTFETEMTHILHAGLKLARPEQKAWNMIVADVKLDGSEPDQATSESIRNFLPAGSTVKACTQKETCRLLAEGNVDAVMYPMDASFPADTIDAVNDFIAKGGVFIDFGDIPCFNGMRNDVTLEEMRWGKMLKRFPFGCRAYWDNKEMYPEEVNLLATEAGLAAGVKQEPTGFRVHRFLTPDRIGEGSEWIPMIAGKTDKGVDLVGAAVVRYKGERKGAAVLCSIFARQFKVASEEEQAQYTARAVSLAMAEGVECYFPYNLRAREEDPYYSEHHFGLMHADFQPKPAYVAYMNFVKERPAGSVQKGGAWHDKDRTFYYPQWTRPDGKKAGMLWTPGKDFVRTIRFTGTPTFHTMNGRKIAFREVEKNVYKLKITAAPIYFSGAEMAD